MTREDVLANDAISPDAFVHFVIQTSRLKEQVEFYQTFLNAHVAMGNDMGAFLTYDDEHHRVAIVSVPGLAERNPGAAGVNHLAYAFKSLGDLLANYVRLKKVGIEPYWCINHGPTTSLYYADVDGNQIETQTDNFETGPELNAFFQSESFSRNPIGVQFDPDALVERYKAGDEEKALKTQGSAPRQPGTEYVLPMPA